jgi:hypothetical protein
MTYEQQKMTKPPWTKGRLRWLLWVAVGTLALVLTSLVLSQNPVAAENVARGQYGEATSSPIVTASPAKHGAETNTTAPSNATQNKSGGGKAFNTSQEGPKPSALGNSEVEEDPSANPAPPSDSTSGQVPSANTPSPGDLDAGPDSEAFVPSLLPSVFPQREPGTGNTTAPSAPQAAVEGLLIGLKELDVALKSLLETMTGLTFAPEQPAKPGAETNTTAPPSATQNTPVQQGQRPYNAPGSSEGGEVPTGNPEPPSDPNGGQVPSGNTSSPSDPNAPWPESGCADPSVLTPQQAFKCEIQRQEVRHLGPYEAPMNPWGPTYEPKYGPKWNP